MRLCTAGRHDIAPCSCFTVSSGASKQLVAWALLVGVNLVLRKLWEVGRWLESQACGRPPPGATSCRASHWRLVISLSIKHRVLLPFQTPLFGQGRASSRLQPGPPRSRCAADGQAVWLWLQHDRQLPLWASLAGVRLGASKALGDWQQLDPQALLCRLVALPVFKWYSWPEQGQQHTAPWAAPQASSCRWSSCVTLDTARPTA